MEDGLLSLKWNNHSSTFFHVLSGQLEKSQFSDVTLACDGELFPAHKLVLSTCSDYFATMLDSTNCKAPIIVLKDVKKNHLHCLLRYMYLGEAEVRQSDLSGLIKVAENLCIKGLAISDLPPDQVLSPVRTTPKKVREDSFSASPTPRKRARRSSSSSGSLNKGLSSKQVNSSSSDIQVPSVARETSSPATSPVKAECLDITSPPREEPDEQFTSGEQIKLEQEHEVVDEGDSVNNLKVEEGDCDKSVLESGDDTGDIPSYTQDDADMDIAGPSRIGDSGLSLPWQQEASDGAFHHELFDSDDVSQQQMNHQTDYEEYGQSISFKKSTDSTQNVDIIESTNTSVSKQKVYKCTVCHYENARRYLVVRHIRTHTGEKPFQCRYCDYSSATQCTIKQHERRHTGDKPYKCTYCGFCATTRAAIKQHERIHTGERPYKCDVCDYAATQIGNLQKHKLQRHHMKH